MTNIFSSAKHFHFKITAFDQILRDQGRIDHVAYVSVETALLTKYKF